MRVHAHLADQPEPVEALQQRLVAYHEQTQPLVEFYRAQPNTDDVTSNEPCDGSDADHQLAVGCIAVVVADTSWQPITPIIGNLVGQLDLQARSELEVELVCPNPRYAAYATSDLCPKQP